MSTHDPAGAGQTTSSGVTTEPSANARGVDAFYSAFSNARGFQTRTSSRGGILGALLGFITLLILIIGVVIAIILAIPLLLIFYVYRKVRGLFVTMQNPNGVLDGRRNVRVIRRE